MALQWLGVWGAAHRAWHHEAQHAKPLAISSALAVAAPSARAADTKANADALAAPEADHAAGSELCRVLDHVACAERLGSVWVLGLAPTSPMRALGWLPAVPATLQARAWALARAPPLGL